MLLRNSGAFFIKRSGIKYPKVYRAFLAEYITKLLQSGNGMEFFIEGTRSRTGKILPAKFGVLKYVYNCYIEKQIPDALILPISINYEQTAEISSILKEWVGGKRQLGSFVDIIKGVKHINRNFGDVVMKMDRPFLLSEFEGSSGTNGDSTGVELLGHIVVSTLEQQTVIMGSHLIAVILSLGYYNMTVDKFSEYLKILQEIIKRLNGTTNYKTDLEYTLVCLRAFDFLYYNPDFKIITNNTPYDLRAVFQLLYYKNITFYLMVQEALVGHILINKITALGKPGIPLFDIELSYERLTSILKEESYSFSRGHISPAGKILEANRLGLFVRTSDDLYSMNNSHKGEIAMLDILVSYINPILDNYAYVLSEISNVMKSGANELRQSDLEYTVGVKLENDFKCRVIASGESCSSNYTKNCIEMLVVGL